MSGVFSGWITKNYWWNPITNDSWVIHNIIKNEMKSIDITRIKQISQDERIELQGRVDETNLNRNFEEDMIIFDDVDKNLHKSNDWTDTYRLFKDLEQLTLKARKKGRRYTKSKFKNSRCS